MKPVAIDLFAGAGGISEGLELSGFSVMYANEINKDPAATYSRNHPDTYVDNRDVRQVKKEDVIEKAGTDIMLVSGGAPCQGFSTLGKRDVADPRNMLVWEFMRIVNEIQPPFFLLENVPGILTIDCGRVYNKILSSFKRIGYNVNYRILNASDFGVPQNRRRVFFFGSFSSGKDITGAVFAKKETVSVRDAISDLNFLCNGEKSEEYKLPARTKYQRVMRRGGKKLYNHESSNHSKEVMKRFSRIPQGQGMNSVPASMRIKKRIMHRLLADEPSRTLTSLPDDYIHYSANRTMTVREMARLQSFDDSYVFCGKRTTGGKSRKHECPQFTQVGNAVPPLMVEAIGEWILK